MCSSGRIRAARECAAEHGVRRPTMFVDTVNALATTLIAALVALITWKQWATDRARLRHELFERRYEIYERIAAFLSDVAIEGRVSPNRDFQFLRETKRAYFVYGGDQKIADLISAIYKQAVQLQALHDERPDSRERTSNLERQREIKEFFAATHASLESTFGKYLLLKD